MIDKPGWQRQGTGMMRFDPLLRRALKDLEARSLRRQLRPLQLTPDQVLHRGQAITDFSSNDYLGLSGHRLLRERSAEWAMQHGTGARASRLVSGTLDLHERVENRLAQFKGTEAALLFASGWQANAAVLPALFRLAKEQTGEAPLVFCDRLNHASMHQAVPPPASDRSGSGIMTSTIWRVCLYGIPICQVCALS